MYTSATEVKITDTYKVSHSYEILVRVANWLIKKHKLRKEHCPVVVTKGSKRYLINVQPKHQDGGDFRVPKRLSNGLYIETHYSTKKCEDYARRLLKRYGYPRDVLKVKIGRFGCMPLRYAVKNSRKAI